MDCNISENIRYVGVDNPSASLFEAQYALPHGMSYNSYIILDTHIAILDCVEADLYDRWLGNVEAALGPDREPAYLVVHHMEPDHSGSIARAMHRWPKMQIVTSAKGADMLGAFFPTHDWSGRITTVKEGDTLGLGTRTLRFMAAPMVHWPEVMVSWLEQERVLFSADAFGKFGALQYADDWAPEAARYYINIVGKYGPQVQALLKKVAPLEPATIAPLHGPVLRGAEVAPAIDLYQHWSSYRPTCRGVLVAYASIYGGTRRAALALAAELERLGAGRVYTADLTCTDQSEAIARAFTYDAMVVAAPTYDAGLYPAMHDFLYHLSIKNYRNRTVAIVENGSWAPMAGRKMREMLEALPGITLLDEMITIRSVATSETAEAILRVAAALASRPSPDI